MCKFGSHSLAFHIFSPKNTMEDTVFQIQRENFKALLCVCVQPHTNRETDFKVSVLSGPVEAKY